MKTLSTKIQIGPVTGDMMVPLPQEIIDAWQLHDSSVLGCDIEGDSIIIYQLSKEDSDHD
jgi:hypothetical protein